MRGENAAHFVWPRHDVFGPVMAVLPFGGTKKSKHGREKGLTALRGLSVLRTMVFRDD
ncbi:MAG: hypothetical protein JNL61_13265 [Rhizobiaceae bacterium]|nr:hypothetical protein [Rhizobiaceae bacterium]